MARKSSARGKLGRSEYEERVAPLQIELNRLARWLQHTGKRLLVLIEGRDTAGDRQAGGEGEHQGSHGQRPPPLTSEAAHRPKRRPWPARWRRDGRLGMRENPRGRRPGPGCS